MIFCVLLLPVLMVSCVMTHDAVLRSCRYEPEPVVQPASPEFYRVGEHYYIKAQVCYICKAEQVCVGGIPVLGGEFNLPISYYDEKTPRTLYVLMAPDAVKACLGKTVDGVAPDAPRVVDAADWDAAAAVPCKPLPTCPTEIMYCVMDGERHRMCVCSAKHLQVGVPYTYSWDAVYKYPLAAALFVGVDVPMSSVMVGAMLVTDLTVGSYKSMFCQQQSVLPLAEETMATPQMQQEQGKKAK